MHAIPADWASRPLGELATVGAGGTPSREVQAFWSGSIPWITTSQIDFNRINAAEQFITEEGLRNSSAKLLPPGTLLLALYGQGKTRGKVGILDIEAATNQACASIVPHAQVSGEFLFHFLASRYELIRNASNSGGQENLSSSIVRSIGVCVPEIREQQAIADVLSDVDFLLGSLGALIAKKRDLKQAAMQQLLTEKRRLVGFTRAWRTRTLGDLAEILGGSTPSTTNPSFWNGEISWCTPTDVSALQGGKYIRETARTITASGLKSSAANLIPAGSVIMTSRATIGECAINTVPLATNQGFKNFVPRESVSAEFLYYLLQTKTKEFVALCSGSTFLEIGKSQLRPFEVRVPEMDEQLAIADALSIMDAEISALESRLAKAVTLKEAIMQQLLTGRIRLT